MPTTRRKSGASKGKKTARKTVHKSTKSRSGAKKSHKARKIAKKSIRGKK
jgi:hypothetical protein